MIGAGPLCQGSGSGLRSGSVASAQAMPPWSTELRPNQRICCVGTRRPPTNRAPRPDRGGNGVRGLLGAIGRQLSRKTSRARWPRVCNGG